MPEERLFEIDDDRSRREVADVLATAADQLERATVVLGSAAEAREVDVPETPRLAVELERYTDPETGTQRNELAYRLRWTE